MKTQLRDYLVSQTEKEKINMEQAQANVLLENQERVRDYLLRHWTILFSEQPLPEYQNGVLVENIYVSVDLDYDPILEWICPDCNLHLYQHSYKGGFLAHLGEMILQKEQHEAECEHERPRPKPDPLAQIEQYIGASESRSINADKPDPEWAKMYALLAIARALCILAGRQL